MNQDFETTAGIDRGRYWRITIFFAGVILHLVWWDILLRRIIPNRVRAGRPERFRRIARRFRELAIELGGVMIKAGQFLSARVDVLPPEITQELAGLQDEVPPEPLESVCQVIEGELGQKPAQLFAHFEYEPQAAASLGQTHRAWLPDERGGRGEAVVLKVQRLNIERLVETDLSAMRMVARWVMLYPAIRRRVDVPALVHEFAHTTWEELDYEAEASNAERLKEMFADDPGVRVPAVNREYSTGRVLLLENVEAIKITDFEAIEAAGIDRSQVAAKLMDIYLWQVFEEYFFHADPHPGNLFIRPLETKTAEGGQAFQIIFVDFGMVGRIPAQTGDQLREMILALALRDTHRIVQAFEALNFFLPGADLERVEEAMALLFDQFWGMSMEELAQVDYREMEALALEFRDLLFDLPFQMPQDFIFLGRAVGMLSGLATSMDPQFNPWGAIEKYGQRLIRDERRWPSVQQAVQAGVETIRPLLTLPLKLETVLDQAGRGNLKLKLTPDRKLERQIRRLERASGRTYWGLVFAALTVSGTILYVNGESGAAAVAWGLAGVSFLLILISGIRG